MQTVPLDLTPHARELVKRAFDLHEHKLKAAAKADAKLDISTEPHARQRGALKSARDVVQEAIDNAPSLNETVTVWLLPEHRMTTATCLRTLWRECGTLGEREQLLLGSATAATQEQERIDRIIEALQDQTVLELDGAVPAGVE